MNFPEAPSERGHLANTSLNYFTSRWGWLKPRACPQGVSHLVGELETNHYSGK